MFAKKSSRMEIARIKNGFLDEEAHGYRDIKINVVFTSSTKKKMICDLQLILSQQLIEKKRSHKLYEVTREREFYQMIVQQQEEREMKQLDPKALQFAPILNAKDFEFGRDDPGNRMSKCAVNSDLNFLFLKPYKGQNVLCVDIITKKVEFQTATWQHCYHNIHWLKLKKQHYLSVQSKQNQFKFFSVDSGTKKFSEDESLRITLSDSDQVEHLAFDKKCENIYLVKNCSVFEKRCVSGDHDVLMSMGLEEKLTWLNINQMALSDDGRWCAIGGGNMKCYWYLIDVEQETQHKMMSNVLDNTYAPNFVNGSSDRIVIGGKGQFEVWDIGTRSALLVVTGLGAIEETTINSICSVHNVIAIACSDRVLRLYDAEKWELVYSKEYQMMPKSLHLTPDLKYLTMAGKDGEECVVLKISQ